MKEMVGAAGTLGPGGVSVLFAGAGGEVEQKGCVELDHGLPNLDDHQSLEMS